MKKLFALVLSLALVVAFAVPALASGWAQLDWQIPVYKDITLTLTGLDLVQNTSAVGSLYAPLSTYYPVVKNSRVHFYVEVNLPKAINISPAMELLLNKWKLQLRLGVSNITLDNDFTRYIKYSNTIDAKDLKVSDFETVDYDFNMPFDYSYLTSLTAGAACTWGGEFWGTVNKDGKDAVVEASIGFYNEFKNGIMEIDNNMDGINEFIVINNKGTNKKIPALGDGYIVDVCNSKGLSNYMYVFFPTSGDKVDKTRPILICANSTDGEFAITKSVVQNPDFLKNNTYATAAQYNALKAVYDKVFKFLGFEYDEANYMTDAHFEHYFGTIMAQSQKITYPNGSVIVNPVTPELPTTGDNASIVGFAMIAVALVAAAVVTVKKVRA